MNDLNAGAFTAFLENVLTGQEADVPCNGCNACCRSSYFIHVHAFERDSLAHIPEVLRFKAPTSVEGDQVMGFDERGSCPMLKDGIFAACGIAAGGEEKAAVNQQVQRWQFDLATAQDKRAFSAVRQAVEFLQTHQAKFPEDFIPNNPTAFALLALNNHKWFFDYFQYPY